MHNKLSKRRDLRRVFFSGDRPLLRYIFERNNPEYERDNYPEYERDNRNNKYDCCPWWDICSNAEDEWTYDTIGPTHNSWQSDNPPSLHRKIQNRMQRRKEKRMTHQAFLNDDWDDFTLPRPRKSVHWLW